MQTSEQDNYVPWFVERGNGPLLAIALHDGHEVRENLKRFMAVDELDRLREEDPFTAIWTEVSPTRVVVSQSRFEIDLNRPRKKAVYWTPEDAWGIGVWNSEIPRPQLAKSLAIYDSFYQELEVLLDRMVARYGRIVVFDLHSFNYRRKGADVAVDDLEMPEINLGTGTMNRKLWSPIVDRFIVDLRNFDFFGRHLDVRENIVFKGGHFPHWVHSHFPEAVCVLSIEVKKFFMNEWTGKPDRTLIDGLLRAFKSSVWGMYEELGLMKHAVHEAKA